MITPVSDRVDLSRGDALKAIFASISADVFADLGVHLCAYNQVITQWLGVRQGIFCRSFCRLLKSVEAAKEVIKTAPQSQP
ncbi:MAG: hypothetical protein ABI273_09125 [Lacunisphaera sp.]